MPTYLIIGSGPSAAAVALSTSPEERITVADLGGSLDRERRSELQGLARQLPEE